MRKFLTITAVVLVVLGVLVVVGDRVGAHYAEREIAARVSARMQDQGVTSTPPEVEIQGFPFLTQVAAGKYTEIDITMRDLKGGQLPLPLLNVAAHNVEAPLSQLMDGTARPVAARVNGDATVSYASLVEASGLTGISLTSAGSNDVRVTGKVPIIGEVTGTAEVTVVDGSHVRLRVTSLKGAAGSVSQTIINAYKDRLAVTLTLPKLPFNLELTDVQTESTGLIVSFTAKDVELA
ncbi:LmeA family phospholipid-binding protein [Catellatospora vulcania]|uniref:LmeA family phospholipid-binding protein n=1 Tax=Catellatospora vulcania TaxID=1460450 RepID=UPI0012D38026|nr:DUF2993 domain-containing protein [Catellatospora vulcania]